MSGPVGSACRPRRFGTISLPQTQSPAPTPPSGGSFLAACGVPSAWPWMKRGNTEQLTRAGWVHTLGVGGARAGAPVEGRRLPGESASQRSAGRGLEPACGAVLATLGDVPWCLGEGGGLAGPLATHCCQKPACRPAWGHAESSWGRIWSLGPCRASAPMACAGSAIGCGRHRCPPPGGLQCVVRRPAPPRLGLTLVSQRRLRWLVTDSVCSRCH